MSSQDHHQTNNNKRSGAGPPPNNNTGTTTGGASAFPGAGTPVGGAAYGHARQHRGRQNGYAHLPPLPPSAAYPPMPPLPPALAAPGGEEVLVLDSDDDEPPLKPASAAQVSDLGEDEDSDVDSDDELSSKEWLARTTTKGKAARKKEQKAAKKAAEKAAKKAAKKAAAKPSGALFGTGSGNSDEERIISTGSMTDSFIIRSSSGATGLATFPNLALGNSRSTLTMIAVGRIIIKHGGHKIVGKSTNKAGSFHQFETSFKDHRSLHSMDQERHFADQAFDPKLFSF